MNPSHNDNTAANESKTEWKCLHYFEEENDEELQQYLANFCHQHSVIRQNGFDFKSIRYVCKQRDELQCGYELQFICDQSVLYSKGEHCHPFNLDQGQQQQENDDGTKADAKKIKKDPRGRGGRNDWRYLGKAASIEEIFRKHHGINKGSSCKNYQHFVCKRKDASNCKYVMRWSFKTHELYEAEEHTHGPIPIVERNVVVKSALEKPKALPKNDNLHGNNYVDRMGRVWHFFAQINDGQSDAEIQQFCLEHGCSVKNSDKDCPFKALLTRANGKAYRLAGHNHAKRKRRFGIVMPKKAALDQQPMPEDEPGYGNGAANHEEANNDDMEVDEDEEPQNEDANVGRKAADNHPAVLSKKTNSEFLNMIAADVYLLASNLELRFDIENGCLMVLQVENRQVGKMLAITEERNLICIMELMGTEFTGREENWIKDMGKEQFLKELDSKFRHYFQ